MKKKKLVTIIGEHHSEAIKNIILLYRLFLVCVKIDVSNKMNKYISVNSRFKLHIPISSLKLK